jgi:Arc/MetJ family transcription regulator
MAKIPLSVRVDEELLEAVARVARTHGHTISQAVVEALRAYVGIEDGPSLEERVAALEATVASLGKRRGVVELVDAA